MRLQTNKLFVLIFLLSICQIDISAQVANDFCNSAFNIANPQSFCSENGEFTNVGGLPSGVASPMCFSNIDNPDNDVWFTFVAIGNTVSANVLGAINSTDPSLQGGTITSPEMALYTGNCDNPCLLYTSPSPRDGLLSRMPSSA